MDYEHLYKRLEEKQIKTGKATCFINNESIYGTLVLTNLRLYFFQNEEQKLKEIFLSDVSKFKIGGINVFRCELKEQESSSFIVSNVLSWLKAAKQALKEYTKFK